MSACITYGVSGVLGLAVPVTIARTFVWLTAGVAVLWYISQRRVHTFALPGRQAVRKLAQRGVAGVFYFGAILGVGLVTEMSTPLVLCGVLSCVLAGPAYGVVYGLGFALGRSSPAFHGAIVKSAFSPGEIVERLYFSKVGQRIAMALSVTALYAWVGVVALHRSFW